MTQPEPYHHNPLFLPLVDDHGPLSTGELEARVSGLRKKGVLVVRWVKAALEAGIIERAADAEDRDVQGRPVGPRLYRITMAGSELLPDLLRLPLLDDEFLIKLEAHPGQTAEDLSRQHSDLATEFVEVWVESAYARGLIYPTERGLPMRYELTEAGRHRLAEI